MCCFVSLRNCLDCLSAMDITVRSCFWRSLFWRDLSLVRVVSIERVVTMLVVLVRMIGLLLVYSGIVVFALLCQGLSSFHQSV